MSYSEPFSLGVEDLEDFVRGAAFLGAGGGGDPYIGFLMLDQQMQKAGPLQIISADDLDHDALVVPVGCMGATTVMTEKLPSIDALEYSLKELERQVGAEATAIIPLEIGGINATLPLVLASRLGLPVVNADGMGRAFPELQMVTFGAYGCPISPVVVANEKGDVVVVQATSNKQGEDLARSVTSQMGGQSQISLYPMSGKDVKRTCVPDTLALAHQVGCSIGQAVKNGKDPFISLFETLKSTNPKRSYNVLFDGKVVDVNRETRGGFIYGVFDLSPLDGSSGNFTVHFQNEFTAAYNNGKIVAMVPDIIVILDKETAEPLTAEHIRFGQRVKVLGITVPPQMTSDAALALFGPRSFGIDADYIPLDQLESK